MSESGVKVVKDDTAKVMERVQALVSKAVFVGIPADNNNRKGDSEFGNASIGYVMENGSPARNIPERPHLVPGARKCFNQVVSILRKTAKNCLKGNMADVDNGLNAVGLVGVASVRGIIQAGIAPALAESTLKARAARGRKGAAAELASRVAGNAPSTSLAKPLIDTGAYLKAITYVVRKINNART